MGLKDYPWAEETNITDIKVHSGFLYSYSKIRGVLLRDLTEIQKQMLILLDIHSEVHWQHLELLTRSLN